MFRCIIPLLGIVLSFSIFGCEKTKDNVKDQVLKEVLEEAVKNVELLDKEKVLKQAQELNEDISPEDIEKTKKKLQKYLDSLK